MARYAISGGHTILLNGYSTSANGIHNELTQDRLLKDKVIEYLRLNGDEAFDCSTPFNTVVDQTKDLSYKVAEVNKLDNIDLAVDIHLNAFDGSAQGVEVLVYRLGNTATAYAVRVVNGLVSLGFKNRGVKEREGLAFLRNTDCKAILIEAYFCDNQADCSLADSLGIDKLAKSIAEAIVGHAIAEPVTAAPTPAQPEPIIEPIPEPVVEAPKVDPYVLDIQKKLNRLKIRDDAGHALVEDGIMGERTRQAIRRFQSIVGITADGEWGPITNGRYDMIAAKPYSDINHKPHVSVIRYIQFRVKTAVDGIFGLITVMKIKEWQSAHGLTADAKVGTNTWNALIG